MLSADALRSRMRLLQTDILNAETTQTPVEFMRWIKRLRRDAAAVDLVRNNETRQSLGRWWWLQRWRRVDISADVTLFRGRPWASGRGLLIGLAGFHGRLMVPTPVFLQAVRARDWDVLIVRDPTKAQFRRGAPGIGGSIPEVARNLDLMAQPYKRRVVLGTSMGGLAAIRLALHWPGTRGISVAGVRSLDVRRIYSDPWPGMAYDPLCDCLEKPPRDMWFLHGATHEQDKRVAIQYKRMVNGERYGVTDCPTHILLAHLWRQGRLEPFLAALLDTTLSPKAVRGTLSAIPLLRSEV